MILINWFNGFQSQGFRIRCHSNDPLIKAAHLFKNVLASFIVQISEDDGVSFLKMSKFTAHGDIRESYAPLIVIHEIWHQGFIIRPASS